MLKRGKIGNVAPGDSIFWTGGTGKVSIRGKVVANETNSEGLDGTTGTWFRKLDSLTGDAIQKGCFMRKGRSEPFSLDAKSTGEFERRCSVEATSGELPRGDGRIVPTVLCLNLREGASPESDYGGDRQRFTSSGGHSLLSFGKKRRISVGPLWWVTSLSLSGGRGR